MNGRIYGTITQINENDVRSFFEKRFCKENPLASVMVRADPNDKIAEKRNVNELNKLRSLYDFSCRPAILDIGCGCGRWASNLADDYSFYCGIDFCDNYIAAAKQIFASNPRVMFKNVAATELTADMFQNRFDLIIINGLCMYLNDSDLVQLMSRLESLLDDYASIYIRESVSMIGERLTLKDFPSEELKTMYNAVYRTTNEYEIIFSRYLSSMTTMAYGVLTNPQIWQRKETNQFYWLLQRQHCNDS